MTAAVRPTRPYRRGVAAWWGVAAVVAMSAAGIGCDRDVGASAATAARTSGELTPMHFNVDPALLGPAATFDLPDGRRVEVRPPAGWKALGADAVALLERVAKAATGTTQPAEGESAPQLLGAFTATDGSMLAVSLVPAVEPPARRAALVREAGTVGVDAFQLGGLTVDQYLFQSDDRRVLRVVVRPEANAGRQLQLDYRIDPATLRANAQRLESSLGSVRLAPSASAEQPPAN